MAVQMAAKMVLMWESQWADKKALRKELKSGHWLEPETDMY